MLKVFRDNIKKLAWVLWVVIAVFVLLVFTDFRGVNRSASASSTAATIAGRDISFAEFQRQYQTVEDRWRQVYGESFTPELSRQIGVPMQAMNNLISQQILLREAEDIGLRATDNEVQEAILEVPAFQGAGGEFIGEDEYRRILRINGLSVDDFERDIRQQVLLQKMNDVMASSAWVSDQEVLQSARDEAETADVRYLHLTADKITEQVEASEADVAAFYEAHKAEYQVPEQRRIGYLSVNTNVIRASLEITEEELRSYYQRNASEFTQEEQVRAQHILLFVNDSRTAEDAQAQLEGVRQRIEAGEEFSDLARELSEDDATKERGGDLGFFGRGRMTPQFEEAAFAAAEGELVGPVENQLGPRTGYHLILLNARREGGVQPFEEVENRIRVRQLNDRSREQAELQAQELYERLADEAITSEDDLRRLAETEGLAVEVTDLVGLQDNIPGIGRATPFAQIAFDHAPGKLSEPVRVAAGWALLDALETTAPRIPDLAEVAEQVSEGAREEKKAELAQEKLSSARKELEAGTQTLDQIATSLSAELQSSGAFNARGTVASLGALPELVEQAMALEQGGFGGPIRHEDGAVLFEVTERNHFDMVSYEETKDAKREQLVALRVNALLQSLIDQRRDQLDVSFNRDFLANFELEDTLDGGPGAAGSPQ